MITNAVRLLPAPVAHELRRTRAMLTRRRYARMSLEQAFTTIYRRNLWGGAPGEYHSGLGSDPEVADAYCRLVASVIRERRVTTVLDLGCGDFQVGARLMSLVDPEDGVRYIGVDIVADLVAHNQAQFGRPGVSFLASDITSSDLPAADLVLVRQVFQHLSNAQISAALDRLARYPAMLVTEHFPHVGRGFAPNRDKVHGPGIRTLSNSAVVIDAPPFAVPNADVVLTTTLPGRTSRKPESLRTWLVVAA